MKTVLTINTSQTGLVLVSVGTNTDTYVVEKDQKLGSQALLGAIQEVLEKAGLKFADLEEITVDTGPGSFTGLRVGVSVANALAYSLGIPVNQKQMETDLKYA